MFQSRTASAAEGDGLALAQVLARNGFRTAAFTGGGNVSRRAGFARGFEIYDEGVDAQVMGLGPAVMIPKLLK